MKHYGKVKRKHYARFAGMWVRVPVHPTRWVAAGVVVLTGAAVPLWGIGPEREAPADRWNECVAAADGTDASLRACDIAYTAETGIELRFMLDNPPS